MQKYIEDFIKIRQATGLSKKSIQGYRKNIEEFCKDLTKPSDIKEQAIIDYFCSVQNTKWSCSTKFLKLHPVKAFCEYLMGINKLILNEKCLCYEIKVTTAKPKEIWSESELDTLLLRLTRVKYARVRAFIELAYSCGLRMCELVKLDLFDLNMDAKTLLIKESKGSDRLLPVTDKAILAIQDYLKVRQKIKSKTTALFITYNGERIKEQDIQSSLYTMTIRLNITKHLTIHCIRASIATHLLRRGMNFVLISKFLGHNHLTTSTIYTSVVANDLKVMIDNLHPRNSMED